MNAIADIAARLRLHRAGISRAGTDWRGDCPACGYARAFTLTRTPDGRLLGWCASCQDKAAIRAILADGGLIVLPARDEAGEAARRERALMLWDRAGPAPGTLAAAYLAARGLPTLAASPALRFAPDCRHPGGSRHPALIARVDGPDGELVAVHRTYLRADGGAKAECEPPRASKGRITGGAIRLQPAGPELVVGEGIETAASLGRMLGHPAWSAVAAGNMANILLPAPVRTVIIACDRDANGAGQRAARAAGESFHAQGCRVRYAVPDRPGQDFNDVLRAAGATGGADG